MAIVSSWSPTIRPVFIWVRSRYGRRRGAPPWGGVRHRREPSRRPCVFPEWTARAGRAQVPASQTSTRARPPEVPRTWAARLLLVHRAPGQTLHTTAGGSDDGERDGAQPGRRG